MNKLQTQMMKYLKDTVKYYSVNPKKRRAITENGDFCLYETLDGKKCAVGRLLTGRDLEYANNMPDSVSAGAVIIQMEESDHEPDSSILEMPESFLDDFQSLHDKESFWDDDNISANGLEGALKIENKIKNNEYEEQDNE